MFVFPNFALVNMTKTMQNRISTFDNFIFCSFFPFLYSFQSRGAVDFVSLARWKGQNQEEDKKRKQRQLWCERLYFCDRRGWVLISLLTSFQDHLSIGLKSAKKKVGCIACGVFKNCPFGQNWIPERQWTWERGSPSRKTAYFGPMMYRTRTFSSGGSTR